MLDFIKVNGHTPLAHACEVLLFHHHKPLQGAHLMQCQHADINLSLHRPVTNSKPLSITYSFYLQPLGAFLSLSDFR